MRLVGTAIAVPRRLHKSVGTKLSLSLRISQLPKKSRSVVRCGLASSHEPNLREAPRPLDGLLARDGQRSSQRVKCTRLLRMRARRASRPLRSYARSASHPLRSCAPRPVGVLHGCHCAAASFAALRVSARSFPPSLHPCERAECALRESRVSARFCPSPPSSQPCFRAS